ncbi:MAG: hypothetical protein WBV78_14575 [Roseobacter sp.]
MLQKLFYILFAIVSANPLKAEDRQYWGAAGDWAILIDEEVGDGCLMQKDFANGIRVEFGYVPDLNGGFFSAVSADWKSVDAGSRGIVKFITDQAKFAGEAEMIEVDGRYGGRAFFNNPNLTTEMAARRSITVIGPEGGTFDVDLTGTSRAISMLKECQSVQG